MREIIFRGKRKDNGEWVEGYFNRYSIGNRYFIAQNGEYDEDRPYMDFSVEADFFEIIPETVGQYTGLTDKNGKKIFEGDVVVCTQEINGNFVDKHIETGYVEMKHGAFGLHRKQGYYRPFKDWLENCEYEVIGNIHDNPELIGGEPE